MVFNRNDQYVGRSLDLYGEFSEFEGHLFAELIGEGDTVIEVGANIGAHTVFLSSAVGPHGKVFALEPQRLVFQTLCANLALNSITNVHALNSAAGRAPGEVTIPELNPAAFQNFGGLSIQGHGLGVKVPMHTVDSLAPDRCRLIKVDVEGMEEEVLAGATATIMKFRPVLYVENDRREKSPSLIRLIRDLGYRMWWHLPPLYNPDNYAENPQDIFPGIVSINLLCIPVEQETEVPQENEVLSPDEWPLG